MWGRGFSVFSLRFQGFFLTHALKWPSCKSVWVHCKTQTSLKVSFNILLLSLNLTSSLQLNPILLCLFWLVFHLYTKQLQDVEEVLCQQNDPNKVWHIPVADICGLLEADFTLSVYVRVYSYECVSTDANIPISLILFFFVFFMEMHISASLWVCDTWFSNQSHVHDLVRAASIKRVCIPVYMCKRKRGVTELLRSPDGEERSWNMKTLAILVLCSLAAICLTSGRSDTTVYVREALYQNYCILLWF